MATTEPDPRLRVISPDEWGEGLPLVQGDGDFKVMVGPGIGASERSLHHIRLSTGAGTVALRHPGEAVYYVISGSVELSDHDEDAQYVLAAGAMAHVEGGTSYTFRALTDSILVGGPSPVDPALYGLPTEAPAVEQPSPESAVAGGQG
jgi:mannose-6-phosphate isomerase-like protein (cupin superfamily)